jgi:hypothetical protein
LAEVRQGVKVKVFADAKTLVSVNAGKTDNVVARIDDEVANGTLGSSFHPGPPKRFESDGRTGAGCHNLDLPLPESTPLSLGR